MHAGQIAILETLSAVQRYIDDKKVQLEDIAGSEPSKALNDILTQFRTKSVEQQAGQANSRFETARQAKLRAQLRLRHLRPIVAVATTMMPNVPKLSAFTVPDRHTSSADLMAAVRVIALAAKRHEAALVHAGLRAGFIERLQAAAAALGDSLNSRTANMGRSQSGTSALKALTHRGRAIIAVLDAAISEKFEFDEDLLGEWQRVKAVRKPTGPEQEGSSAPRVAPAIAVVPIQRHRGRNTRRRRNAGRLSLS